MMDRLVAQFEKSFPGGPLIHVRLSLPADAFSLTVLFGPSESGKTTVLRCRAGLGRRERGYIRFGRETWFDSQRGIFLPPQRRRIGYLFQEYALFPHMTVAQNIRYGLPRSRPAERRQRVEEITELFGLAGLEPRYPKQLSGGQQQRVALARALVCRPRLLLLDEPLSSLDVPAREQLRRQLRKWLAHLRTPGLFVTHDRIEALALGDDVVILDKGQVCQSGPVREVFAKPAAPSVARIVGVDTVEPARILHVADGLATVKVGSTQLVALARNGVGEEANVCIRAEEVMLEKPTPLAQSSARNRLPARVISMDREGPLIRVSLDCGFPLKALVTNQACEDMGLRAGENVAALLKVSAIHLIPRGSVFFAASEEGV